MEPFHETDVCFADELPTQLTQTFVKLGLARLCDVLLSVFLTTNASIVYIVSPFFSKKFLEKSCSPSTTPECFTYRKLPLEGKKPAIFIECASLMYALDKNNSDGRQVPDGAIYSLCDAIANAINKRFPPTSPDGPEHPLVKLTSAFRMYKKGMPASAGNQSERLQCDCGENVCEGDEARDLRACPEHFMCVFNSRVHARGNVANLVVDEIDPCVVSSGQSYKYYHVQENQFYPYGKKELYVEYTAP